MDAVYHIVCSAGVELTLHNLFDRIQKCAYFSLFFYVVSISVYKRYIQHNLCNCYTLYCFGSTNNTNNYVFAINMAIETGSAWTQK